MRSKVSNGGKIKRDGVMIRDNKMQNASNGKVRFNEKGGAYKNPVHSGNNVTRDNTLITPSELSFFGFDINNPPRVHKLFNPFSKGAVNFGSSLFLIRRDGSVEIFGYRKKLFVHPSAIVEVKVTRLPTRKDFQCRSK